MNAIEQAEKIYPLLVQAARERTTFTYGEINRSLGYKHNASGHAIRPGMDLIVLYCFEYGSPQLTSLIVNKKSGKPTEGYAYGEGENINHEHLACYAHKWEASFDYAGIWNRRFQLRKKYNLTYGSSGKKK
jgi:hypothetical protein